MRTFRVALAAMAFAVLAVALCAADDHSGAPASSSQTQSSAPATSSAPEATRHVTAYSLPPALSKKAHDRSRINFRLTLIGFVYGLVILWLILRWKLSAAFRSWAEKVSSRRFLQALIFSPLLLLTVAFLTLPLDIYG